MRDSVVGRPNSGEHCSVTVVDQIRIVKERFGVEELVFVGDRGMVKSKGKQALREAGLRWFEPWVARH